MRTARSERRLFRCFFRVARGLLSLWAMGRTAQPTDRIELLDALRGFTLLGILVLHMVGQFCAGPDAAEINVKGAGDRTVAGVAGLLVWGKFFTIFALLFGLSFHIQLSRSGGGLGFAARFVWRLIVLFVIGLIHHLHYPGDVLTVYATLGLLLVLLQWLPDRWLLAAGLLLALDVPSVIVAAVEGAHRPAVPENGAVYLAYCRLTESGTYLDVLRANLGALGTKAQIQVESGRIYVTAGLFLLGLWAGRKQILSRLEEGAPLFRKLTVSGLCVGLCAFAAAVLLGGGDLPALPAAVRRPAARLVTALFNGGLALFYGAGFAFLFTQPGWRRWLRHFFEVGRMGLTTYLMQTLFGILLFSGLGLGLVGKVGAKATLGLAVVVFLVQVLFAKAWFARFRQGPVEWVWRSLTRMEIQPISRGRGRQGLSSPLRAR